MKCLNLNEWPAAFPNNDAALTDVGPLPSAGEDDRDWRERVEQELQADFPEYDVGFFPYRIGQKEAGSHWGAQCLKCGWTVEQSGPIKLRNEIKRHEHIHRALDVRTR